MESTRWQRPTGLYEQAFTMRPPIHTIRPYSAAFGHQRDRHPAWTASRSGCAARVRMANVRLPEILCVLGKALGERPEAGEENRAASASDLSRGWKPRFRRVRFVDAEKDVPRSVRNATSSANAFRSYIVVLISLFSKMRCQNATNGQHEDWVLVGNKLEPASSETTSTGCEVYAK